MEIHLQDQDVPVGKSMQLHITATNEGIGFGGSGIYFLKPSALMVTCCCGLIADLGFIPLVFWHSSTALIVL
jgi:hypothetical protein